MTNVGSIIYGGAAVIPSNLFSLLGCKFNLVHNKTLQSINLSKSIILLTFNQFVNDTDLYLIPLEIHLTPCKRIIQFQSWCWTRIYWHTPFRLRFGRHVLTRFLIKYANAGINIISSFSYIVFRTIRAACIYHSCKINQRASCAYK